MNTLTNRLLEGDKIPDVFIRSRIRQLLRQRLRDCRKPTAETQQAHLLEIIAQLKASPIAIETRAANEQHYEVPTAFFQYVMGRHMKYSCCYWDADTKDLSTAEQRALQITVERAELRDGMEILELGCGWGSLTMFMAAAFPNARITAVSNSGTQRAYITQTCAERGLHNVEVITADMNTFHTDRSFDRVVSVEMFEHMRNYRELMHRISQWLKQDGKLFVHIFTHVEYTYFFDVVDDSDWMSKYFFSGGIMPSDDLLLYFNEHMVLDKHWHWDGTHYGKTAEAWLQHQDMHRKEIMPIMEQTYGREQSVKWWVYWRIFFMACAELWNYRNGREWIVSHYLFEKR